MNYASLCSGSGACALALGPLGYKCQFFAELEPFASAVLEYHWPNIPNIGDFTKVEVDEWKETVELVIGGTPCQSFSQAGKQQGMDDERGLLALAHVRLARALGAKWIVWENVPRVFSTNGGRDFSRLLETLVECGYGFAWRVLNAEFFGVAQRRRRVFLVGYLGDWRPPAAVLFESQSMPGDPSALRKEKKDIAGTLTAGIGRRRGAGACVGALTPSNLATGGVTAGNNPGATHVVIAKKTKKQTARNSRHDANANETVCAWDPTQITSPENRSQARVGGPCHTLHQRAPAIAGHGVRRLTPKECERLQGMPDDHTLVPYRGRLAADTPRYRVIGNAFAVPVVRWIGERLLQVEVILQKRRGME